MPTVKADDLEMALSWVSEDMDNGAWVCRETGKIYWEAGDVGAFGDAEEELPDDIHDQSRYAPIPDKYDLDLGNQLAYDFARQFLPGEYDEVRDIFRRKGAWRRFKDFLDDKDLLEQWYAWSDERELEALVEWAEDNGFDVEHRASQPS